MAKYEAKLTGDFDTVLETLHTGIMKASMSASFEDGSDMTMQGTKCSVRVYERYSMLGSNRVSLSLTLFGNGNELFLSAITSGGSQAVIFKINTFGEEAFLDTVVEIAEKLKG